MPFPWEDYPYSHPGWDALLEGMYRVTRIHGMPDHWCRICDQLRRQLAREKKTSEEAERGDMT